MILPDLNLLLYAYNPHVPQHAQAARWWEQVLRGEELIGLPYEVCFGFIRIATHQRLGPAAVPLSAARSVVETWLDLSHVRVLTPGASHFDRGMDLMERAMGSGSLLSDAVLAAYALEHRATLYSNDSDFARFPELDWTNPLQA